MTCRLAYRSITAVFFFFFFSLVLHQTRTAVVTHRLGSGTGSGWTVRFSLSAEKSLVFVPLSLETDSSEILSN